MLKLTHKNYVLLISIFSFSTSLILNCIKLWVAIKSNSILLTILVTDGLIDILTSVITFIGVFYAQKPIDYKHRFGHGKAEAIAAFLQAILLLAISIILGIKSLYYLIIPKPLFAHRLGIIIIIISIFFTLVLIITQTLIVNRTKSIAIIADRAHYIMDIIINIFVLIVLIIENKLNWIRIDAIGALIISCYMIWYTRNIIIIAFTQLLDQELSNADRWRITETVLHCSEVKGIHDLRTRNGGNNIFIELHVEVDGRLSINAGHIICDQLEAAIKVLFITADVCIHLEPAGILDKRLDDYLSKQFYA